MADKKKAKSKTGKKNKRQSKKAAKKPAKKTKKKSAAKKSSKKKEANDWKRSNLFLLLSILIIAAIAVSIVLYVKHQKNLEDQKPVFNSSNYYGWANHTFIKNEKTGDWETRYTQNGQEFILSFYYGPRELQDMEIRYVNSNFGLIVKPDNPVYIVIEPESADGYVGIATASLAEGLNKVYNVKATPACTEEHESCPNRPIIASCGSTKYPTIFVKNTNTTSITYYYNCLFLNGEGENLIKAANKALLGWYGLL